MPMFLPQNYILLCTVSVHIADSISPALSPAQTHITVYTCKFRKHLPQFYNACAANAHNQIKKRTANRKKRRQIKKTTFVNLTTHTLKILTTQPNKETLCKYSQHHQKKKRSANIHNTTKKTKTLCKYSQHNLKKNALQILTKKYK